ncbi:MAG: hypothetical protein IJP54_08715 [Synergistaceae bacterium]|nr:hypothetical protein [Synergistaceae bacterium]
MKSCSDSEYELLTMKSIYSSGCGLHVMVSELERRHLHSVELTAKNSKQGIFSGININSIDSSGYGLLITAEVLERKPLHVLRALASNQKQAVFPGQNPFRHNEEAVFMKSIDSSGCGLPIICSKHNKEEAHYYVQ